MVDRLVVDGTALAVDPRAGRWLFKLNKRKPHDIMVRYHGTAAGGEEDADLVIDPAGTFLLGGWYPTFDDGLISYELTVDVPVGQLAVAPGKLVEERSSSGRYKARYISQGPMEEIALFAGPYVMRERWLQRRRLRTYFDPSVAELAPAYLEKAGQYLEFYEAWIGAYPYAGFDVVSGPRPLGLGFPGLTYVGSAVLRLPFLLDTSLGHEVLHSWWGNGVLIDASRGNWAEGLTTFMADYTYEERKGEAQAAEMRRRWMREYAALPPDREQPLTAFRSRQHTTSQVVGYHKAAMVFFMLRDVLGQPAFDRGLRRFWERNHFRRASWDDLWQAFEAVDGEVRPNPVGVRKFFSQWIERAGAPMLALSEVAVRQEEQGFVLSFVLSQTDPAYKLRVPLVVDSATASRAEAEWLDLSTLRYQIGTPDRPHRLCVDPDFRLFRRPGPGEVAPILRSAAFDPSAPVVIAALNPQVQAAARNLAARLLEREPQFNGPSAPLPDGTAVLVGTDAEVEAVLKREALDGLAPDIARRGTARAWTVARLGKGALVVVSGEDAGALSAIAGPLPHYGAESFVVFEGRRLSDRGVWPAGPGPLCVELESEDG